MTKDNSPKITTKSAKDHVDKGNELFQSEDYRNAISNYNEAIQLDP